MLLANLDSKYCRVVRKDEVLDVFREKGFLSLTSRRSPAAQRAAV